ncbi:hypothetical protein [Sedimenticola thiotaurini]|uniref:Uncharacterized protein n=1 Tax=Sedimenticola thiotaurini TaxID=1543721 RepID=A0A0F7JZU2_9GAMM|nr:hypothetical protein [Sedimenticola thiotaurini]AKH21861.1 hypothetical protein AAY24_17650 [Sedimenticola thiotaurini]
MNKLATYISAIKNGTPDKLIADRQLKEERVKDDDLVTEYREQTVRFVNGVTIQQSIEVDLDNTVQSSACPECWISYKVVAEPADLNIVPKRKVFVNACQESFWLKINTSHRETG